MIPNIMTPYMAWVKPALYVGAAIGLIGFGFYWGGRSGAVEVANLRADYAVRQSEATARLNYLTQQAREQEQQWSEDLAMIAAKFEDDKQKVADETQASVLADIRAGRVRVRLPSCPGVSAPSKTSTGSGVSDGQADDGSAIAATAIGIGAEADTRLAACQAVIKAFHTGPR